MKRLLIACTLSALLSSASTAQESSEKKRERDQPDRAREEKPDWESIEKRLKSAVERGDLTRDQAKAKLEELKKNAGRNREEARERPPQRRVAEEVRRMEMMRRQQAEVAERLEHSRRQLEEQERDRNEHAEREHRERNARQHAEAREHAERERGHHHRVHIEAIEKSLHQAVEAGLISEFDARKTMAKLQLAAIKHQKRKARR